LCLVSATSLPQLGQRTSCFFDLTPVLVPLVVLFDFVFRCRVLPSLPALGVTRFSRARVSVVTINQRFGALLQFHLSPVRFCLVACCKGFLAWPFSYSRVPVCSSLFSAEQICSYSPYCSSFILQCGARADVHWSCNHPALISVWPGFSLSAASSDFLLLVRKEFSLSVVLGYRYCLLLHLWLS
jgi:hypothetical protein